MMNIRCHTFNDIAHFGSHMYKCPRKKNNNTKVNSKRNLIPENLRNPIPFSFIFQFSSHHYAMTLLIRMFQGFSLSFLFLPLRLSCRNEAFLSMLVFLYTQIHSSAFHGKKQLTVVYIWFLSKEPEKLTSRKHTKIASVYLRIVN